MKVENLIAELQKLPRDVDVHMYVGKCCDVQPIHRIQFQPSDGDQTPMVILVDETEQVCIPGRCNCS